MLGYTLMNIAIQGIGTHVPGHGQTQSEVAEFLISVLQLNKGLARRLKSVFRLSGIERRYSVISDYCIANPKDFRFFQNVNKNNQNINKSNINNSNCVDGQEEVLQEKVLPSTKFRMQLYKEYALSLALGAIKECCKTIDKKVLSEITHVITVSCTGMYAPGLDIEIVQALNLSKSTERIAINFMGCYGVFNALKTARAFCIANKNAKVLIVSVELCSLHIRNMEALDDLIAGAIFADGAGALLISQADNIENIKGVPSLWLENFHCDLMPQGSQDMSWAIADLGFDIVLSSYVPQLIENGIKEFIENLLQKEDTNLQEIDFFAIHPGGIKILEACERALNITPLHNQHSYHVLNNFGNMSSATIIFVLKSLWDKLNPTDHGKKIWSCAFGPGITLESMLLSVNYA